MRDRRPFWRRRLLRPILGLLAANLVALVAFTLPRRVEERSAAERAARLEREVAAQREVTLALRTRAEAAEANAKELERFYESVVCRDAAALLQIQEDLERTVAEVGLPPGVRRYSPQRVDAAPLERVEIRLPATGSYAQLGALLDRLERSPHFLIVEQIHLREGQTGGQLDVTVSTYCRASEEPVA